MERPWGGQGLLQRNANLGSNSIWEKPLFLRGYETALLEFSIRWGLVSSWFKTLCPLTEIAYSSLHSFEHDPLIEESTILRR